MHRIIPVILVATTSRYLQPINNSAKIGRTQHMVIKQKLKRLVIEQVIAIFDMFEQQYKVKLSIPNRRNRKSHQ